MNQAYETIDRLRKENRDLRALIQDISIQALAALKSHDVFGYQNSECRRKAIKKLENALSKVA